MKVKNIVLTILIFSLILSFSACSKEEAEESALTIGTRSIDKAIFSYYLDTQISTGEQTIEKETAIKNAEALCVHYVEINTEFEKRELKLSSGEKAAVASEVEEVWGIYGKYYENIGVSKEDITKIKTSEAYEDVLIRTIYGEGGEKEISEDAQKDYFEENYIFIKVINAYLSGDEEADEELEKTFESLEKKITEDNPIDAVNMEYVTSIGGSTSDVMEVSVMQKGSDTFPEGFFEDVIELDDGDTDVLTYDNYIFLVEKQSSDDYFSDYQTSILNILAADDFSELMNSLYEKIETISVSSVENSCYSTIKSEKTK